MSDDSIFRSKGPELLISLADLINHIAKEMLNLSDTQVQALSQEVALQVAQAWGGQLVYMPQGAQLETAKTHLEIFEAFNGKNHADVARKFGISLQSVYRIVKRVRKETLTKMQGDLFVANDGQFDDDEMDNKGEE
ncbi:Mor transcription activator family protein [Limnobaculum xujianqingii]|uniref:Mor transcription activator family protein n=1 Tax=Limnobaculum xujianqingii TaxID=2738837 RepID=UPI00112660B2|nr:Mor transcription activator family protein [Limnobaculum xujianqingii]